MTLLRYKYLYAVAALTILNPIVLIFAAYFLQRAGWIRMRTKDFALVYLIPSGVSLWFMSEGLRADENKECIGCEYKYNEDGSVNDQLWFEYSFNYWQVSAVTILFGQ